jgi:Zn ribbon nucleic-acid-binding protein
MFIHRPLCPKCKTKTMLARITPGPSGFEVRTFECPACDHIDQVVIELADPMKAPEVAGWFQGELRAPS